MRFRTTTRRQVPAEANGWPWLENTIAKLAPSWAAARREARATALAASLSVNALGSLGNFYDAGKKGAPNSAWLATSGSADDNMLTALPIMRARARHAYANAGDAVTVVESFADNVIGTGLTPEPDPDGEALGGLTDEQLEELRLDQLAAWDKFVPYADVCGDLTAYELQEQWFREGAIAGDVYAREVQTTVPGAPFSFAYETIEAERVDNPHGGPGQIGEIRGGVETDPNGMPTHLWVIKRDKSTVGLISKRQLMRVPIWDGNRRVVHHWFKKLRAGQTRGLPWFAPVLEDFKNLADYGKAELFRAKVSACLTFIVQQKGKSIFKAQDSIGPGPSGKDQTNRVTRPGQWVTTKPGEDVKPFMPSSPHSNFEGFNAAQLRKIAGAFGTSYENGFRDYSKTTWSAARDSEIQVRRMVRKIQSQFASRMCTPMWHRVQREAYLRGELRHTQQLQLEDLERVFRVHWHGPGYEWVDPANEAKAIEVALRNGFITREMVLRQLGRGSFERMTTKQIAEELMVRRKRAEAGLPVPPAPGEETDEPDDEDDEERPDDEGRDPDEEDDDEETDADS